MEYSTALKQVLARPESLYETNNPNRRGAVLCFQGASQKIFIAREDIAKAPDLDEAGKHHLHLIDIYHPERGELVLIFCHQSEKGRIESMILGRPDDSSTRSPKADRAFF